MAKDNLLEKFKGGIKNLNDVLYENATTIQNEERAKQEAKKDKKL